MRVYIVSPDIFDKYVRREDIVHRYLANPVYGKTSDSIRAFIKTVTLIDTDTYPIRYYVDWAGHYHNSDSPTLRSFEAFLGQRLLLVEDFSLGKYEAYHWKDYLYKMRNKKDL